MAEGQTVQTPLLQAVVDLYDVCRSWHHANHDGLMEGCEHTRCRRVAKAMVWHMQAVPPPPFDEPTGNGGGAAGG